MIIINVGDLLERIFTLVKCVKKPLVKIFPDGRVIGTDEQFSSLNMVIDYYSNMGVDIFPCPFILDTKEITAFMREVFKDNSYKVSLEIPYGFFASYAKNPPIILHNEIELNYKFDELYNKVLSQELTKPILYTEEDFQCTVPEMFSLKSSDGAKMYNINTRFLMTSFNAIHPTTKSDKVTLIIRDSDLYSYTAEFIIHKKKENYDLHEILRFRKL